MALREINNMIAKDLSRKATVKDYEDHARRMFEEMQRNGTPKEAEFYRGCLRAIEVLRKAKLLRE